MIQAIELVACHVSDLAEQTRQRLTFGDVGRYLAMLASHHHDCACGHCVLVSRVTAQRVYAIASGWQRQVQGNQSAGHALIVALRRAPWLILGARNASVCEFPHFDAVGPVATKTRETPVSDSWRPPRPPTR